MKVLIYKDKNTLEPIGGPTGYLYNLYNEIQKNNITQIEFLDLKKNKIRMKVKKIYKKLPKKFQKKYKYKKNIKEILKMADNINNKFSSKTACINLDNYDIIHFHDTYTMYMVKESLESYKGKIIITSHSPEVYHKELIERIPKEIYLKNKEKIDKLEVIDEYCFNRADYILFPCEEAEEPYYHTWSKYNDIKKRNFEKYIYVPTGIIPKNIKDNSEDVRRKVGIPEDAFVISYVGRHTEIKGYDDLKKIGKKVLERYDNVYFLIAGTEQPLKGLEHKRWIEVGWTSTPMDYVNASDMFILPNKETYFDLILLEVMSIGKTILLTETGGNKYFKRYNDIGLFYYKNEKEALEKINDMIYMDLSKYDKQNQKIMLENFTTSKFLNNYLKTLYEIYGNKGEKIEK